MLESLQALLILGILVQASTEIIKKAIPISDDLKSKVVPLIALAIGLIVSISCQVDILTMAGITNVYPIVSYILTGIIASGGATAVNEIIKAISETRISNIVSTDSATDGTEGGKE